MSVPPIPNHVEAVAAVAACGIPAANIHAAYEMELQSDAISISDLGGIDPQRLACLRAAVHPYYVLNIEQDDQRRAYFAFAREEDRREARPRAIQWLTKHALLDRVPVYRPQLGGAAFARALERACDMEEGSMLEMVGRNTIAFRSSFFGSGQTEGAVRALECVGHMLAASNGYDHGVELGIVGNGPREDVAR